MNQLCGCGKPVRYQVGTDADRKPIFACNKFFRCPTYEEQEKMLTERGQVILYGLSLIALAQQFDVRLGEGWQNFKEMAKKAGFEYENPEGTGK
ncbi:MAG: hypothetical protein M3209_09595 [Acidobacteriota bacterium]|nr:hypothetical protein [Acidobacteriota bacterium]